MKTGIMVPRINMNGNTKSQLVAELAVVEEHLKKAIEALRAADYAHPRNFQTVSARDAEALARKQHESRLAKLEEVYDELYAMALAIDEQGRD
jgi:hypothetical protein